MDKEAIIAQLAKQFSDVLAPLAMTAARKSRGDAPADTSQDPDLSISKYLRGAVMGNWHRAAKEKEAFVEAQKDMDELDGASGGFLVHAVIAKQIIEVLRAKTVLRSLNPMYISNLTSNAIEIPKLTTGATAYWTGESKEKVAADLALGMLELRLKEVACLVKVGENLIEDSTPTADSMVKNDLGAALALAEETAILNGTGGAQPLGLLNWPGIGATAFVVGDEYDTLMDALAVIETANDVPNGWIMHPAAKNILRQVKDGNDRYIWYDNMKVGEPSTLLGLPVAVTTAMPAATVLVGNFQQLLVVEKRAGIGLKASDSAGDAFEYNQIWFRATRRIDSGPRHIEGFQTLTAVE